MEVVPFARPRRSQSEAMSRLKDLTARLHRLNFEAEQVDADYVLMSRGRRTLRNLEIIEAVMDRGSQIDREICRIVDELDELQRAEAALRTV